MDDEGGEVRRRSLRKSSQSDSISSAVGEAVKSFQRSSSEVDSVLDNSGTCVDSEEESRDDFVDGMEFMRRLSAEQRQKSQQHQREVKPFII